MAAFFGPVRWAPVSGGFSGSAVWRGDDVSGTPILALKRWPASMSAERLVQIHGWMNGATQLQFVPHVLRTNDGGSVCLESGCVWDVTTWMRGESSALGVTGATGRATAACTALAQLHRIWRQAAPQMQAAPAVRRRLAILNDPGGVSELVARFVEPARNSLLPWLARPLPVQPCLCDLHGEHVLFGNGAVTGVIDYGAMKPDHVAVDLARYLGDVCGEDEAAFESGLAAYRSAGGILDVPSTFVRVLDRTGLVCALIGWERRLEADSPPARVVLDRVERLRARLATLHGI